MNSQAASVPAAADHDSGLSLSYGYGTDRGLRRELNEDSFIASDPVFAVADGMGGHEAGEIASGMCVRALAAMPQLATGERSVTAAVIQQYLVKADNAIRRLPAPGRAQPSQAPWWSSRWACPTGWS